MNDRVLSAQMVEFEVATSCSNNAQIDRLYGYRYWLSVDNPFFEFISLVAAAFLASIVSATLCVCMCVCVCSFSLATSSNYIRTLLPGLCLSPRTCVPSSYYRFARRSRLMAFLFPGSWLVVEKLIFPR